MSDDTGAFAQSNPTLAYSSTELARAWRDDRAGNADIRAGRITYGPGSAEHFGYSYDGLECLTAGTTTNPESFTLDAGSNISSRTGPTATFTYDTSNRLTNDGTQTFTWNTADRLTNRGSDTFGYDPLDRMTSSTVAATARTYAYNGDGLLKSRTQGTATQFLWDPSSSPSRLLVQGGDRIVYGLGPLWVVKADASTSSFARDGGKSVRAEVNGSGTVTASFRYRAYGAIAQSNGATTPSYLGYAGQLQDPSGLLYMRARWYDPAIGRFTTRDPLPGDPALPITTNGFAYGGANPLLMLDPTGLAFSEEQGGCETQEGCASASSPRGNWAYAIADVFRDLDSSDGATQGAALLKVTVASVAIAIPLGIAAAPAATAAIGGAADAALALLAPRVAAFAAGALPIVFKATHVLDHYGGDEAAIQQSESAIGADIAQLQQMGVGQAWWGWVNVGQKWIQYRAEQATNGVGITFINVGTHFPVSGPLTNK